MIQIQQNICDGRCPYENPKDTPDFTTSTIQATFLHQTLTLKWNYVTYITLSVNYYNSITHIH